MANEKKFLDLVGLTRYDGKIKAYADTAASTAAGAVDTGIREEYKVKDVDLTDNGKVALTLDANGKVGVTVDANVVKDADYATVKSNANNSAAAWNQFLVGSEGVAPTLVQLATKDDAQGYATTAQSAAIAKAGELDAALESKITTAYEEADATVKSELIGNASDTSSVDTIKGAKKYADEKAGAALTAANNAQAAANGAQAAADAAQGTANEAKTAAGAAQGTADQAVADIKTINETKIPNLESAIGANTALIGTTKAELIGDASKDTKDSATIAGAKKYADDLANGLSTRIDDLVAGGIEFKGVVNELPAEPNSGDLIIMGADVTVGDVTYKKDYEYIYTNGAWYELGDSDKNAKAIAAVDAKADTNTGLINAMDAAYKAADSTLAGNIETVSKAAVKSIVGGNSTYVTVTAGDKDDNGKVTLTVTDNIANTFDTIESVNGKISTAKAEVIGTATDAATADTIKGAKKYADDLVNTLEQSFVAISNAEIDALFQ